jgi:NAD(P)-dependent dehydrogenase (short-subunit alcohol dehydrogenase family)
MDFKGKGVVITGSGAGVGKKAAQKFLEHGARVMINDLDEDVLKQTEEELLSMGEVVSFKADVTDSEAVQAMAQKAIETFAGVDIWLNNAGTARSMNFFTELTKEDWDFDIGINLYGVLNGCKAILPHFIEKNAGKIVNTVSDAGRVGEPRLSVYSAAKAGVIGFTKALAREVGRYNVMVNCVALGTTKTERMKMLLDSMPDQEEKMARVYAMKRLGETDDAANALLLMSSDYVTWITGQTLSSSGGFSFVS